VKAFPKTERKILTVTIDENGDMLYLKTDSCDVLLELGETVTKRASHVEPVSVPLRYAFRLLRMFGDKTRVAEWTRHWQCEWLVDTRPVGGPVLTYADVEPRYKNLSAPIGKRIATWRNRQDAIDAEIIFLNEWFLTR
jgi:hypothetical protein